MVLHPSFGSRVGELRQQFQGAQPFRHVVIEPFLDPASCGELIREFPAFDAGKAVNETGAVGGKSVISALAGIGPAYARLDGLIRSAAFLKQMGEIASVPDLIYDPDYAGGGTHENLHGQDLDAHVDFNYHPASHLHRRLNLILFLNEEWLESWGGCLELQRDPWNPEHNSDLRVVVPLANRAVIFETTESSWHGFRRIQLPLEKRHLSRRSVAVYFYTKQRPEAEVAAPHGTVYVPRPLAEHFRAGHTLTEDDVNELAVQVARRDAQIRYLYERELEISQVLHGTWRSPSYRIGRALTWPVRRLLGKR